MLKVKVKVKGHVIRALLCWHENRFFSQANGRTATKLAHDGLQVSLHPGCAQGQGQRSRDTGTLVLDLKSLFLAGKWLDCHQTCTRWSPGKPASRMCSRSRSRSKFTWYGHFCDRPKIAFSHRQMARLRPNLHKMVFRGRMHNTVGTAAFKLKSIYDGLVFASVCMTPSER